MAWASANRGETSAVGSQRFFRTSFPEETVASTSQSLRPNTRDTLPAEWVREVLSFIDPLQPPDGSVAALEAVLARADSLYEALCHF